MSNRMELNEEALEQVVGGAFHFLTDRTGKFRCVVDGVGTFYARSDAYGAIAAHAADTSLTSQQIVDWAISNGILSSQPMN